VKLPHLPSYCAARQRNAAFYTERLASCEGIVLPTAATRQDHIWNQYTLRVPGTGRRDALRQHFTQRGIGHEIYYPLPLHQQACFAHLPKVTLPVSEQLAAEVLSIPVFPELTADERAEVAAAIADGKWRATGAAA
jgi:dTDP-4-amino-4,6-dideoxygalactose transaminase